MQPILPRKHRDIFFYLATSSVVLASNVTALTPLLCCRTCRAPSQLTGGQHGRAAARPLQRGAAPPPSSRQGIQVQAWDVHGQTAAETPLKTSPQQPLPLPRNEGRDGERWGALGPTTPPPPPLAGAFSTGGTQSLAGGRDRSDPRRQRMRGHFS